MRPVPTQECYPLSQKNPAANQRPSYLADEHGLRTWFMTTDHKRIGIMYLIAVTAFFFSAGSRPARSASS